MSGFTIELKGLDKVIEKLDIRKYEQAITDEFYAFGEDVARDAKQLVPVDEGFLKNSISSVPGKLSVTIVANADYAAYVEFGTRRFAAVYIATLPPDWQTFAAQFKGAGGGSFDEFVLRLVRWCKVKGIPEEAAYPIARSILRNGIKAQPFLFPAFEKNRTELLKNLRNLFKNA